MEFFFGVPVPPYSALEELGLQRFELLSWTIDGCTLAIPLMEYAPQRFRASAFDAVGIRLPEHIARSVVRRQADYFFGRLAARSALEHYGLAHRQVATGEQREPVWPAGVVGSITHAAPWCAAAVLPSSRWRGVGIDIELPLEPEAQASVIATALSADERAVLAECGAAMPEATLLTLAFSAKESFYKGMHSSVGRFFGFEAMRILAIDPERGYLDFITTERLGEDMPGGAAGRVHFRMLRDGAVLTAFVRTA